MIQKISLGLIITTLLIGSAPMVFAQDAQPSEDEGGLFTTLRERQISNRERIKTNLRALIETDTQQANPDTDTSHTPPVITDPVLAFAYQLDTIAGRLESHILLTEFNEATIPATTEADFVTAQETLIAILASLEEKTVNRDTALEQLRGVRTQLLTIIRNLRSLQ